MPHPKEPRLENMKSKATPVDKSVTKSLQDLINAVRHKNMTVNRVPRVSHIMDEFSSGTNSQGSSFMSCIVIGHPFLTYHVRVNKDFLRRRGLKPGRSYIMKDASRTILHDALRDFKTMTDKPFSAGGVAIFVAIATQWMLSQPNSVVFLGSRGIDEEAGTIIEDFKRYQVAFRLEAKVNVQSSAHVVLHCEKQWCQVYYLEGKAPNVSTSYIDRPIITKMLERANLIFTTDLSILLMPSAVQKLAYYASSRFKLFSMQLVYPDFISSGKEKLKDLLTYIDILFLNYKCAEALIKIYNLKVPCSLCHSSRKRHVRVINNWVRSLSRKTCTVVMSDGLTTAYVYTDMKENQTVTYKSNYTKDLHVVDMYGVSYGFLGGFLALMLQGKKVDSCIDGAFFCASKVASSYGVDLPANKTEILAEWKSVTELRVAKSEPEVYAMPFTIFKTPWKNSDLELMHEENSRCNKNKSHLGEARESYMGVF